MALPACRAPFDGDLNASMQYDDRLATVLHQRGTGQRAAHTQYRQLLDLLGRRKPVRGRELAARAWTRMGELREAIGASVRAGIVAETGWQLTSPELVRHLADDEPAVAAAALARASLSADDWHALIPRLPIRARGFLRFRNDLPPDTVNVLERLGLHDRALPVPVLRETDHSGTTPANQDPSLPPVPPPAPSAPAHREFRDAPVERDRDSDIGRLVKRIEAFRRARAVSSEPCETGEAGETGDPRLPLGDTDGRPKLKHIHAFDFTSDANGRIDWASETAAPMVEGASLTGPDDKPPRAWRDRTPLSNAPIRLYGAEAVAGTWIVDAAPFFTQAGGAFAGYAGRFRRPAASKSEAARARQQAQGEQMRQMLHELRTPVNAIQGFSELIHQQLFGPVPHEYRAYAAAIAGDAARILAGFDELDRLARLQSGALDLPQGSCDFAAIVRDLTAQLQDVLAPRMAGFDHDIPPHPCEVALDESTAKAAAWRLLAALGTALSTDERIELALDCGDHTLRLKLRLPAVLTLQDDIFRSVAGGSDRTLSAGAFGTGFALRLARAEALAAGGSLREDGDWLILALPRARTGLTGDAPPPSERASERP